MNPWIDISRQIERYAETRKTRAELARQRAERMRARLREEIAPHWEAWRDRASNATGELLPDFDGPPNAIYPVEAHPPFAAILSTDGSQIFPSQHEIAPIALIQVSRIRINYADLNDLPLFEREATVLPPEDVEDEKKPEHDVRFTDQVSDERSLMELAQLADLAESTVQRKDKIPVFALTDGSLILWRLAGREDRSYEKEAVEKYRAQLKRFQQVGVPVAGYISGSNSREIAQLIEFAERESGFAEPDAPPITDAALFFDLLREGQRSAVFHSRSKILVRYKDQRISYFFLRVGSEVAKIEIPRWVADRGELLDALAAQCWMQARLGDGYPIILAEAHEQAVIRGADREAFYALLEQALLRNGITPRVSPKQLRKRASIL